MIFPKSLLWFWPDLIFVLLVFYSADDVSSAETEKSTSPIAKAAATKSLMAARPPAKCQQVEGAVEPGLMLGEVYGQVSGPRAKQVKQAIERALKFSQELQSRPKRPVDKGGWRYVPRFYSGIDSDLSVTGWQLMFFRSAKNAEFNVPE